MEEARFHCIRRVIYRLPGAHLRVIAGHVEYLNRKAVKHGYSAYFEHRRLPVFPPTSIRRQPARCSGTPERHRPIGTCTSWRTGSPSPRLVSLKHCLAGRVEGREP